MAAIAWNDPSAVLLRRGERDRVWLGGAVVVAACVHAGPCGEPSAGARAAGGRASSVSGAPRAPATAVAPLPRATAAAVLTRSDDAAGPVDLTDSFVVGSAATYGGGATSASGSGSDDRGAAVAARSPPVVRVRFAR